MLKTFETRVSFVFVGVSGALDENILNYKEPPSLSLSLSLTPNEGSYGSADN